MNEEEIKKKMLQQRIAQLQVQLEQQQVQQVEAVLKDIMIKSMTKKARERLNNIRVVKPELAMQLQLYLAQLYQAGQIKQRITEQQLIEILKRLGERREFKITRK